MFDEGFIQAYNDDLEQFEVAAEGEQFEACFLGMAMGWSWALFFCHDSISDAMRHALRACGLPDVLVADGQRPSLFTVGAPAAAPYVDNANILARDRRSGGLVFEHMVQALGRQRVSCCATELRQPRSSTSSV